MTRSRPLAGDLRAALPQLVRYGVVGATSNAVGYLLYLALTAAGVEPKLAMSLLYATAVGIGYWGNRRWTFGFGGGVSASLARFLAAHLAGYGLNFALLALFHDRLGYPHALVQFAAIFIVAGFLFVAFRWFVFPAGRGREPAR